MEKLCKLMSNSQVKVLLVLGLIISIASTLSCRLLSFLADLNVSNTGTNMDEEGG